MTPPTSAAQKEECCDDWKPNVDKINSFITTACARAGKYDLYDGKPFVFCPWCGAARATRDPEDV
jgi:hypothetical protein